MPRPWVENEDGPLCSCGRGTVVKVSGGRAGALCLFHTSPAGLWIELPTDCPDDFVPWTDEDSAAAEESEEHCAQKLIAGQVGAFIPLVYARYWAKTLRSAIDGNEHIPQYLRATLQPLYTALRTAEADDVAVE